MMRDPFPRVHQPMNRLDDGRSGVGDTSTSRAPSGSTAQHAGDETPSIVVIGIGNNLLGDDGAGIHVIEHLKAERWPVPITFLDGGTLSFSLLEHVETADRLVIIDAAFLDAPPGTVAVFRNTELEHFLTHSRRPSVHEVNLLDVLGAARLRGRLPGEYALVAIEPEVIHWSSTPSPAVAAAIDEARERVAELIEEALS